MLSHESRLVTLLFPGEQNESVVGQVLLLKVESGFNMLHVDDREDPHLKECGVKKLRELATHDGNGRFRPLRSSPDLVQGWKIRFAEGEFIEVLEAVYPGVAYDLLALVEGRVEAVTYEAFAGRQTGMYRITSMLEEPQIRLLAEAHCDKRFCLKDRLWKTGAGEETCEPKQSRYPCLEPCPMLMEFARKSVRMEQQEERVKLDLSPDDYETIEASLSALMTGGGSGEGRVADYGDPCNPRRIMRTLGLIRRSREMSNNDSKA